MRYVKNWPLWLVTIIVCMFLCVELSFFVANAVKLLKRLFFLVFEFGLIFTMYIWYKARKINDRFVHFINLKDKIPLFKDLSADQGIPKYASHLVYFTKCSDNKQIEQKIIYSIFNRKPKRADIYWFIHLKQADDPYMMEYTVDEIEPDKVIRVEFHLGFRIPPRIDVLFRKVIEDMVGSKEFDIISQYESLKKNKLSADFRFVIMEKFLSYDNEFSIREGFILHSYFALRKLELTEAEAFGLDTSDFCVEKIPFVVKPVSDIALKRVRLKGNGT